MNVIYTNACSLRNKRDELLHVAHEADIVGVAETWLSPNEHFHAEGFVVYREDRLRRAGGGCALLIREDLPHSRCASFQEAENIQAIACDIHSKQTIRVVCVYRSPSSSVEEDERFLKSLLSLIRDRPRWVLIGDLNAPSINWVSETTPNDTSFDHKLIDTIQELRAHQHIDRPTRVREGAQPSLLDLIVTPFEGDISRLAILPPIGKSDHVVLKASVSVNKGSTKKRWHRAYNQMVEEELLEHARRLDWEANEVEMLWRKIKSNILLLETEHVPLRRRRNDGRRPWYTKKVCKWTTRKNQAWSNYTKNPSDRALRRYKRVRNKSINITRQSKSYYELRLARNANKNPKQFYAHVQSHTRLRRQVTKVLKGDSGDVTDDREIAVKFQEYFLSVYRTDTGKQACTANTEAPCLPMLSTDVSVEETLQELKVLNTNKSMGPDGIHPAMLKILASMIAVPLTELFNRSLSEKTIPNDWKVATVVPIHKGKALDSVENYRPVSLTSVAAKILERILRRRIAEFLTANSLINPSQHGFTKGRSCLTNLLVTMDKITDALDRGERVLVGYLDFQKAFDSVNHRLLIHKMRSYCIAPGICDWIEDFLRNRCFRVKVRDTTSDWASPTSGVPQGTVLGPLLFMLYVNDLTVDLSSVCLLFADDVKVINTLANGSELQRDLDEIKHWSEKWDLPLNPLKCVLLGDTDSTFSLGEHTIPFTPQTKDLGVVVTANFMPSEQCAAAAATARKALYALRGAVSSRSPEVWIPLYCAFVRPHLEYCVQAWAPYQKKDIAILEKIQRTATRWIEGLKDVPYEDRLKRLGLFSLERRRLRGDLIETYKIMQGLSGDELKSLVPPRESRELRGHKRKLTKRRARLDIRRAFFSNRVVNPWNCLPQDVVEAPNIRVFKEKLDSSWERCFPDII